MCRDVFHTKLLDEYGELPLSSARHEDLIDVGVAVIAGIIAAAVTLSLFRNNKKKVPVTRGDGGDVEFSPLPSTGTCGEDGAVANENGVINGNNKVV